VRDVTLKADDISYHGSGLSRPECIVAEADGTLWVSDSRGGVTRIDPGGRQTTLGRIPGLPNGFAPAPGGSFIVAEIDGGGIYRLGRDGRTELLFDDIEGRPLGSANFIYADAHGRIWGTVSTRTTPRIAAVKQPVADGYLFRIENGRGRIVADGLHFTNEARADAAYRHLYVVETALGRIIRFPIGGDGELGSAEPFGPDPLFPGALLDGIAFDAEGALWVTEVSRNGIHRIMPDGRAWCVFEDPGGAVLDFPASLTFAGPDLRTVYVGSTRMSRLGCFISPVPGAPLPHWRTG
jgi:gluconolactonase